MREKRKRGESGIYHIILRGNNQQNLFYDDEDRYFFLNRIKKYSQNLGIDIYAYCLMGNHVHILIGKGNDFMSLFVKKLACSYVYYFNHKYERTGHLFQGRYKSEPVDSEEYFKVVYRYIIQNPEKAGICAWFKYQWSSKQSINHDINYVKISFVFDIFNGKNNLIKFLYEENDDLCMEYNSVGLDKLKNDELKTIFIKRIFEVSNIFEINHLPLEKIQDRLKLLKNSGIKENQIARLTGISRKIIKNA
ncbi:MAG: transposase [Treponema sp.]|nr:transposase [Treponema sp.]